MRRQTLLQDDAAVLEAQTTKVWLTALAEEHHLDNVRHSYWPRNIVETSDVRLHFR